MEKLHLWVRKWEKSNVSFCCRSACSWWSRLKSSPFFQLSSTCRWLSSFSDINFLLGCIQIQYITIWSKKVCILVFFTLTFVDSFEIWISKDPGQEMRIFGLDHILKLNSKCELFCVHSFFKLRTSLKVSKEKLISRRKTSPFFHDQSKELSFRQGVDDVLLILDAATDESLDNRRLPKLLLSCTVRKDDLRNLRSYLLSHTKTCFSLECKHINNVNWILQYWMWQYTHSLINGDDILQLWLLMILTCKFFLIDDPSLLSGGTNKEIYERRKTCFWCFSFRPSAVLGIFFLSLSPK